MGEEEIFGAALDIGDPAERIRFLYEACGDDENLRRRVERLLVIHEAGLGLPDRAARDSADDNLTGEKPSDCARDFHGLNLEPAGITIVRRVGSGGFGFVYEGWQQGAGRRVAVKVLREGLISSQALARFAREARLLAKLNHPGIAAVLTTGQTADGVPYLVTEFVEGARRVTEHARDAGADLITRVKLLRSVCEAVGHAHGRGVLHRDLKPGNILVDAAGSPKVIDFGWACALDAEVNRTTTLTVPGQIVGTWQYMSPEQFAPDGSPPTAASDVWSLGVIAFELLAGRRPYEVCGKPLPAIVALMVSPSPPPPLVRINSLIPEQLSLIVEKCLERSPSARYRSAGELADDLGRFLEGEHVRAKRASFLESLFQLGRRHPIGSAALSGLLLGLVVAVVGTAHFASVAKVARDAERSAIGVIRQERESARAERDAAHRRLYASTLNRLTNALARGDSPGAQSLFAEAEGLASRIYPNRQPKDPPFELRAARAEVEKSMVTFRGHVGRITDIASSPDGTSLASAGEDGTLRIWDTKRGLHQVTLTNDEGPLRRVRFAPDGRTLLSVDRGGRVCVWDTDSWRPKMTLPVRAKSGSSVAFSPDASRVAIGSDDGSCRLWDLESGSACITFDGHDSPAEAIAWSPDGRAIATAGQDKLLRLWNALDGTRIGTNRSLLSRVMVLDFSPDSGTLAAGGRNGSLLLWPTREDRPQRLIQAHASRILSLAFSPDGTFVATGANDQTIRVFDSQSGETRGAPLNHDAPVNSIAFVDGPSEIVAATADGSIVQWDTNASRSTGTFPGHRLAATKIVPLPKSARFASVSVDGTIRLWDGSPQVHDSLVTSGTTAAIFIAFGKVGREAAVAWRDGRIATVDPTTSTIKDSIESPGGEWDAFAASEELNSIVACSQRGTLRLWNRPSGRDMTIKNAHNEPIRCVAITPDGSRCVSGGRDGPAILWDASSGERIGKLPESTPGRSGVAVSPDGSIVAIGAEGGAMGMWETFGGRAITTLDVGAEVEAIAFGPSGSELLTADASGLITVWDRTIGQPKKSFATGYGAAHRLVFSDDGRLLAALHATPAMTLWDTTNWEFRTIVYAPRTHPSAVAFTADGSRVATGCYDGTLRLWDTFDGTELFVSKWHARRVMGLSVSPDGQMVLSAGGDGAVRANGRSSAETFARRTGRGDTAAGQ